MAKRKIDPTCIELMDTTLRDGEQTPNLAYTASEKFQLARLLLREVQVDRIEIGSTRVSAGEEEAVRRVVCAAPRTPVLFSGGSKLGDEDLLLKARLTMQAGAAGLIFGRNIWQRPYKEALAISEKIVQIMKEA